MKIKILNLIKYILFSLLTLLLIIILKFVSPGIWNYFVTYPKLEKEITDFRLKYKKTTQYIPLQSHKGVLHSHSYWSHDSRGLLPEILAAAKKAELEFIFLSDHPHGKLDVYPRGFHGKFDGVIIESGTEYSSGFMINPFDSTVLDWKNGETKIIHDVVTNGGLATYVHSEKPHPWDNPDYHAMEIYNIHTDVLDENGISSLLINNAINGGKYMNWCYREFYDDQTKIHSLWDSLNQNRRIVGVGAVDAHNNHNFRARYLENGLVEWVGPNADTISIKEENWMDKLLLGKPDEYGWAFRWDLDSYFDSFNHVSNQVFCDTFSNVNIKDNIIKGHLFVSFESLAKAQGFQYFSTDENNSVTAILGDSVLVQNAPKLKAFSPYPVKFQLFKNGLIVDEKENVYDYEFPTNNQPGNYRITASIYFDDKWTTWVLTNPIYIY
ncbi:hypothetical protein [Reichenbachiella sp. MALMAid0571]|uniref:hypothetical protein n=1 Tax=Reichenbachiella sp. MALMAid0571 TaxID=3143939 RepID=UPI0032DFE351